MNSDTAIGQWAAARVAAVCKPFDTAQAPTLFAPGVKRLADYLLCNRYTGSAEALVACGLVRLDQLPGQPGNGKVRCTYDPAGRRVPQGRPTGSHDPGRMTVERVTATRFRVDVNVSYDEQELRRAAYEVKWEVAREARARPQTAFR